MIVCPSSLHSCVQGPNFPSPPPTPPPSEPPGEMMSFGVSPVNYSDSDSVKCHLKGKTSRKWANGQNIYHSENKIDPRGSSVPVLGLKQVYWHISQISGERLQDHWSSGFFLLKRNNPGKRHEEREIFETK